MDTTVATRAVRSGLRWWLPGLVLFFSEGLSAQGGPQAGESARGVLEEVIVTARRVEESLQDTPVSVTAFGQAELEQIGLGEVRDISDYTPNLDIRKSLGATDDLNISLRGMFQGDPQLGIDPTVGVYLDGVYISRNAGMAFDLADIERIEVLRGPQGTLFGRNTIGGAINIITQDPRGAFALRQQLTDGSRGRRRFHTTLDTPSLGGLSARLSFLRTEFDGTVESLYTGENLGSRDSTGGRLQLMWAGEGPLSLSYSFDVKRADARPNLTQVSHTRPAYADPDGEFYGGGFYDEMRRIASSNRVGKVPIVGQTTEADIDGHALTVQWRVAPALTFESTTSFREMEIVDDLEFVTLRAPADGSLCASPAPPDYDFVTGTCTNPVPAGQLVSSIKALPTIDHEQWTQEFRLLGNALDDRLRYTAGLYYFREQGESGGRQPTKVVVSAPFAALGFSDATGVPPDAVVPQNRGNSLLITIQPGRFETDYEAYAVYGEFSYDVLPRLEATLGFRYSVDDKTAINTDNFDGEFQAVTGQERFTNFSPSLSVSYNWREDISTYAKVATGYRAGGFNARSPSKEAFVEPFEEEEVTSYELGWKTELLDRSLRFNGALFYADYTNRQITQQKSEPSGLPGNDIRNAGEAVHSGIELEAVWMPLQNLRITAGYAHLDVDVEEFFTERLDPATALATNPGVIEDVSDAVDPLFVPDNTANLAVQYHFNPAPWGQLTLRVDATFTDSVETGNTQIKLFDTLDARTLLNARATLADIPFGGLGGLRVALWGKNLANKEYPELGSDLGVLGFAAEQFAELRSFGVDLVYELNR